MEIERKGLKMAEDQLSFEGFQDESETSWRGKIEAFEENMRDDPEYLTKVWESIDPDVRQKLLQMSTSFLYKSDRLEPMTEREKDLFHEASMDFASFAFEIFGENPETNQLETLLKITSDDAVEWVDRRKPVIDLRRMVHRIGRGRRRKLTVVPDEQIA